MTNEFDALIQRRPWIAGIGAYFFLLGVFTLGNDIMRELTGGAYNSDMHYGIALFFAVMIISLRRRVFRQKNLP